MPDIQRDPCPSCGRPPEPYKVLLGFRPCRCGGHATRYCRADAGGCGETLVIPPMDPDTCTPPRDGFGKR